MGETWGLAVSDELFIRVEFLLCLVMLLSSEQNFDVEWPEPQTAYTRFGRRDELLGLAAELFGFIYFSTTKTNVRETSQRFEMRIQQ